MPTITPIANGPAFAKLIAALLMNIMPTPASVTAAPNAINPTAPAVNVGATDLATSSNAPIATDIPTIAPTANGPAFARFTAAFERIQNPALINNILAPNASIAVDIADNFFVPPFMEDNIFTIPTLKADTVITRPARTPTANGPVFATATADCASK